MIDPQQIKRNILNDMRVELTEEFDRNFIRKAFFTKKWKPRFDKFANGSLLIVTGTLRRSIRSRVETNGVRFTSAVPYATTHNEGGYGIMKVRAHYWRKVKIPQRQFVGDGSDTRRIIQDVITDNLKQFDLQLTKLLKT